jgi:hypothetical protein
MVVESPFLDADGFAMTVFQALGHGARSLCKARGMLLVFYTAATIPAVIGTAVLMTVPFASLGHSTWAIALGSNLDASWIAELVARSTAPALPMLATVVGLAALARVLQLFLLGGTLQIFGVGEPFTPAAFFSGCGRHFWRLVRLALFALVFFAVAGVISVGLNWAGNKIWDEGSKATPLIYWNWFRIAVIACLLGLCNLVFDYAAIRLAAENSRKSVRTYLGAFRFIWRAPFLTIGLYIVLWLVALLFFVTYFGISQLLPQTSLALIFLLFLVRQATVLAKVCSRLLFYSAQCCLYRDMRPIPVPEEPACEMAPVPASRLDPLTEAVTPTSPNESLRVHRRPLSESDR